MKKYFSAVLAIILLLSMGFGFSVVRKAEAASHSCVFGGGLYDIVSGTPCAIIASCVGEAIDHKTGVPCKKSTASSYGASTKTFAQYFADSLSLSTLKYGNRKSDQVAFVQNFLNAKGLLDTSATGNFLAMTKKAVQAFQKSSGLRADGIFGSKSLEAMRAAIAQDPALARNLANRTLISFTTPAESESGSGNGNSSGGAVQQTGSGVACGTPVDGNGPKTVSSVITNDNFFKVGAWDTKNQTLRYISQNDGGDISTNVLDDTQMSWRTPKFINFTLSKDEKLFIAALNDKQIADGLLGQFTFTNESGVKQISLTRGDLFEKMRMTAIKPALSHGLAFDNALANEIKTGDWMPATEIGKNGMNPWGLSNIISPEAMWLKEWGVLENDDHPTLFLSKGTGNGTLPPCETCPAGSTGTYPDCNPPVSCPAGYTGTPPDCTPVSPTGVTSVTGVCRGVGDNAIDVTVTLTLSEEVTVTGTPVLKIVSNANNGATIPFSSKDGTKLIFQTTTSAANPYDSFDWVGTGMLELQIPSGASIKKLNGTDANLGGTRWNAPAGIATCTTTTPPPAGISHSMKYSEPFSIELAGRMNADYYVTFPNAPIVVTGLPTLGIKNSVNNQETIIATYADMKNQNGTVTNDTLHFKVSKQTAINANGDVVDANSQNQVLTTDMFQGVGTIHLAAGQTIKNAQGQDVNLTIDNGGVFTDTVFADVENSTIDGYVGHDSRTDKKWISYKVTFKGTTVRYIPGASGSMKIKIKNASGVEKVVVDYTGDQFFTNSFYFTADLPLDAGYVPSDFEGTGRIELTGTAKIVQNDNARTVLSTTGIALSQNFTLPPHTSAIPYIVSNTVTYEIVNGDTVRGTYRVTFSDEVTSDTLAPAVKPYISIRDASGAQTVKADLRNNPFGGLGSQMLTFRADYPIASAPSESSFHGKARIVQPFLGYFHSVAGTDTYLRVDLDITNPF